MKINLTLPQIKALSSAGVEIQAGTGDGWSASNWKGLSNAIEKLKEVRDSNEASLKNLSGRLTEDDIVFGRKKDPSP